MGRCWTGTLELARTCMFANGTTIATARTRMPVMTTKSRLMTHPFYNSRARERGCHTVVARGAIHVPHTGLAHKPTRLNGRRVTEERQVVKREYPQREYPQREYPQREYPHAVCGEPFVTACGYWPVAPRARWPISRELRRGAPLPLGDQAGYREKRERPSESDRRGKWPGACDSRTSGAASIR